MKFTFLFLKKAKSFNLIPKFLNNKFFLHLYQIEINKLFVFLILAVKQIKKSIFLFISQINTDTLLSCNKGVYYIRNKERS